MKRKTKTILLFLLAVILLLSFFGVRSTCYFPFQAKLLYKDNKTDINNIIRIYRELDNEHKQLRIWKTFDGGIGLEIRNICCVTFASGQEKKLSEYLDKFSIDKEKFNKLNGLLSKTGLTGIHSSENSTVLRIKNLFPNGQASLIVGQPEASITDAKPIEDEVYFWKSSYY